MKGVAGKAPKKAGKVDPRFSRVIAAFANDPAVSLGEDRGFGSGALKISGRIFAMMSSRAEYVVKLPKARVDDLAVAGKGRRFRPGHGREIKEWFVVRSGGANWVELAKEARDFVKRGKP